jgi:uncharacterized membrane protein
MFGEFEHFVIEIIEIIGVIIDIFGVVIIVGGLTWGSWVFFTRRITDTAVREQEYRKYKFRIARTLILGLEILVAADIIKTVAIEATIENVAVLAFLVLVRTFLSWTLVVEIEGHWPWQRKKETEEL